MNRLWAMLASGLLALPGLAAGPGTLTVDDKARAFTADGVAKAKGLMEAAEFQSPAHLTVVTGGDKDVPAAHKAAFETAKQAKDSAAGRKIVADWAADAALQHSDKGLFVLIYTEGRSTIVVAKSDRTTDLRGFGKADDHKIEEQLAAAFKAGQKDQGLYEATAFVVDRLKNTTVPAQTTPASAGGRAAPKHIGGTGMSIGGLLCVGLMVMLGLWLVFGIIRAFSRPAGYGPGYGGPGYGGGGYGGGGGGFMSGLMGGLFGAVAGNYLYNSFLGGGSSLGASGMDGGGYGGAGGYPDAAGGDGDYAGGSEGGGAGGFDDAGGDSGGAGGFDDASGGDYGGGGGDYGGGGGDFGGGGGDFGGGGGDW